MKIIFEPPITDPDGSLYSTDTVVPRVTGFAEVGKVELAEYRVLGYLAVSRGISTSEVSSAVDELTRMMHVDDPDRAFGSYPHLTLLFSRGIHAVMRAHQLIVDFKPGRIHRQVVSGPSHKLGVYEAATNQSPNTERLQDGKQLQLPLKSNCRSTSKGPF